MLCALQARLRRFRETVRFRPFDTSTPEGRARERNRRAALTSLSAALAKAISLATPLVTLPLTVNYLGTERYGLWVAITSAVGMLMFADLGLGNGLMTAIAEANGRQDIPAAQRSISSAFFLLSAVAGILFLLYLLASQWISWSAFFNVTTPDAAREAAPAVTACVAAFALNVPSAIVQRVQAGYQEGYQSNLWQCAGSLLGLAVVLTVVMAHASLPTLVLGLSLAPVAVAALNGGYFFGVQRPWLRPRWREVDSATARRLLRTGLGFLAISALTALGIYSDNVVAARVLGPEQVTQLAVPARMASFLVAIPFMLYAPMWTANGEAIARGDLDWVETNLRRLLKLSAVLTLCLSVVFVLAGGPFVRWYVSPELAAPLPLMIGLAGWALLNALAGPAFMVLNGAKVIRPQIMMFAVFTPLSIATKVLLARKFGVTGIVWATFGAYALLILLPLWALLGRTLRNLRAEGSRQAPRGAEPSAVST